MSVGGEGRAARHDGPHTAPHQQPDAAEDESVHDGGHLHIIIIITIIITIFDLHHYHLHHLAPVDALQPVADAEVHDVLQQPGLAADLLGDAL